MKKYRLKPRFYVIVATTGILITSLACSYVDKVCSENITEARVVKPAYIEEEAPEFVDLGEYKITHYCSCPICCDQYAENRPVDEYGNEIVYTASGAVAEAGKTIAVDPEVIPLGSTVYIDGKEYVAEDVGGAIKGNRIDIYSSSHDEALNLGVKYSSVYMEN
jgi:3D (Asp-Asp-Asp) domain-containing protein